MKKKVIKLNESDLQRLVEKIIKEERKSLTELGDLTGEHDIFGDLNFSKLSDEDIERIERYFNRNKKHSSYKTDDGDLKHGTFDELDESESDYRKIMLAKRLKKFK